MTSSICTLFENHYHYGVAALINSLYQYKYRGTVYAGYRGTLPFWSLGATENLALSWPGSTTLEIAEGLYIHFLPLTTEMHLANYKPEFMLNLWKGPANNAKGIAYFDPDIVINCNWDFYEAWMTYGVALVHEVVSNDMPVTHPIRLEWKEIIKQSNRNTVRNIQSYINSGFCGVSKQNIEFLQVWANFINTGITVYKADPKRIWSKDKTFPFCYLDQDALNIAAMCSESAISEIGPEGMSFVHGGFTMSHSVGSPKPWKKNFIVSALKGEPPSSADRHFWTFVEGPVITYSKFYIKVKRLSISFAGFICRFYRRR